jgi:putative flavoprotein involved in K+ transport
LRLQVVGEVGDDRLGTAILPEFRPGFEPPLLGLVLTLSLGVVVVGAGQAGLGVSRELVVRGVDHVVLERGRVGETWRSQRWDSFVLNTPVWMNRLPGSPDVDGDSTRFPSGREFVEDLERYARSHALPVVENVNVLAVEQAAGTYLVKTSSDCYRSRSLIVAAGIQRTPKIPVAAAGLSGAIEQLHTGSYRRPELLEDGGVLVVGSGQSGCQIAEELLEAGRRVYLATSRVGRLPRRHRGRDTLAWRCEMGFYDQTTESLDESEPLRAPIPIATGIRGGHTLSLQQFSRDGAVLLGHLDGVAGTRLRFAADVAENVRFGDAFATQVRRTIDDYVRHERIDAPPAEDDPVEAPEPRLGRDSPRELDLHAAGVKSVIWATGFGGDYGWLPMNMLDQGGAPAHTNGIGHTPGLYVLGFPWISKRKSGIVYGIAEDASRIASHVVAHTGNASKLSNGP